MSPLTVYDPTGIVRRRVVEGQLAPRLSDFHGRIVGIIDDGLIGSPYDMRGLEQLFREEFEGLATRFWDKPILSRPSPAQLIAEVAESCDTVVIGSAG